VPVELTELDHLGQLLGNLAVPTGKYSSATLTLVANTFPGASTFIPDSGFGVLGVDYNNTAPTYKLTVPLTAPLVVDPLQGAVLDLNLDTTRSTFLFQGTNVEPYFWANFNKIASQKPVANLTQVALRPLSGSVTSVAADGSSMVFNNVPIDSQDTLGQLQPLTIRVDATSGTQFWDLSQGSTQTVTTFSSLASVLPGLITVVVGQLQPDGSIIANRVWYKSNTNQAPDALVLCHLTWVKPDLGTLGFAGIVATQSVLGSWSEEAMVDAETQVFLRNPTDPAVGAKPIAVGPAALTAQVVVPGFEVLAHLHLAGTAYVVRAMEILTPQFMGALSGATASQITCSQTDGSVPGSGFTATLAVAPSFAWTQIEGAPGQGSSALADLAVYAQKSVDFGGLVGKLGARSDSQAVWGGSGNPKGWSLLTTECQPAALPQGSVTSPWVPTASGGSFGLSLPGGTKQVTVLVDASTCQIFQKTSTQPTALDPAFQSGTSAIGPHFDGHETATVYGYPDGNGNLTATLVVLQPPSVANNSAVQNLAAW
jgi:hypothetical protein